MKRKIERTKDTNDVVTTHNVFKLVSATIALGIEPTMLLYDKSL